MTDKYNKDARRLDDSVGLMVLETVRKLLAFGDLGHVVMAPAMAPAPCAGRWGSTGACTILCRR